MHPGEVAIKGEYGTLPRPSAIRRNVDIFSTQRGGRKRGCFDGARWFGTD